MNMRRDEDYNMRRNIICQSSTSEDDKLSVAPVSVLA